MTICVASICSPSVVIGLSDRMLTAGDLEFTPHIPKIRGLTNSIAAMVAGDVGLAFELLGEIEREIQARITAEPRNWWLVRDVADLWRAAHIRRQQRDAETSILAPLGLSTESFVSRQRELASTVVDTLSASLRRFQLSDVEVIFAGIDPEGPHLYQADGAMVRSRDAMGFAAIGSGAYHAQSELRVVGHTPRTALPVGLYHTFAAKKRAEAAPGVGSETDSFVIWELGRSDRIRDDVMQSVGAAFHQTVAESARIVAETETAVTVAINEIVAPRPPPDQVAVIPAERDDRGVVLPQFRERADDDPPPIDQDSDEAPR